MALKHKVPYILQVGATQQMPQVTALDMKLHASYGIHRLIVCTGTHHQILT